MRIKLCATDVDGTLTDGGMYYSSDGEQMKLFNTRDGMGFELLRNAGIETAIITSETSPIVEARASKLKVEHVFLGASFKSKLAVVQRLCKKLKISLDEVAYIGDDVNCIPLLQKVGLAACPDDSAEAVKKVENIRILTRKGGKGAFRELVDLIVE